MLKLKPLLKLEILLIRINSVPLGSSRTLCLEHG